MILTRASSVIDSGVVSRMVILPTFGVSPVSEFFGSDYQSEDGRFTGILPSAGIAFKVSGRSTV